MKEAEADSNISYVTKIVKFETSQNEMMCADRNHKMKSTKIVYSEFIIDNVNKFCKISYRINFVMQYYNNG